MRANWLYGFLLALLASGPSLATPTAVPAALRDWVPWALEGQLDSSAANSDSV